MEREIRSPYECHAVLTSRDYAASIWRKGDRFDPVMRSGDGQDLERTQANGFVRANGPREPIGQGAQDRVRADRGVQGNA